MKGKTLVIILLVTLFDIRDFRAQSIIEEKLEKLSLYLSNKDVEKAKRVRESINLGIFTEYPNIIRGRCVNNKHTNHLFEQLYIFQ